MYFSVPDWIRQCLHLILRYIIMINCIIIHHLRSFTDTLAITYRIYSIYFAWIKISQTVNINYKKFVIMRPIILQWTLVILCYLRNKQKPWCTWMPNITSSTIILIVAWKNKNRRNDKRCDKIKSNTAREYCININFLNCKQYHVNLKINLSLFL